MAVLTFDWLVGLALLLGGMVAGGVFVRLLRLDASREKDLTQELERTRDEFESYRREVAEHFRGTAQAVNQMTESYRNVYEQLRRGAEQLCPEGAGPSLEAPAESPLLEGTAEPATEEEPATGKPAARGEGEQPAEEAAKDAEAEAGDEERDERAAAKDDAKKDGAKKDGSKTPAKGSATSGKSKAAAKEVPDEPRAPLDYAQESEEEPGQTVH